MKILILGGTQFVGLHLVESALQRGHEISLFNRGKSNPELFAEVEKLVGDRDGDLKALEGRQWDAVIDVSAYIPRHAKHTAELLADAVECYVFISTVAVYADWTVHLQAEDAPLVRLEDPTVEQITAETYGGLKVLCEEVIDAALPGRALHIRPGYIIGPHDTTDRFTYWVRRIAQGGEVLVPNSAQDKLQAIDARDLAEWTLTMTEAQHTGAYNAVGLDEPLEWGTVFDSAKSVTGSDAELVWVSEDFMNEHEVGRVDVPLWTPSDSAGLTTLSNTKAREAGLTYRPLETSIRDTYEWDAARDGVELRAGLRTEREAELLAAWKARG